MLHLLVNPSAGRGRGERFVDDVVAEFRAHGAAPIVTRSTSADAAMRVAAQIPAGGTLAVIGGDGSLHAVLPALLERQLTLGILPAGSGDDTAYALGIPRFDPRAAARIVLAGRTRQIDVGLVNGAPFLNAFGSGFDAQVAHEVQRAPALFRDQARYLYGILRAMALFRLQDLALEFEDGEGHVHLHRGPSLLVSAQNGPRGGGSFLFAPGARVDDGLLDVVVAGAFGRLGTLGILGSVMRGTHEGHPQVFRFAARRLRLLWPQPLPGHGDGEPIAAAATFEVSLRPGALRVLAP